MDVIIRNGQIEDVPMMAAIQQSAALAGFADIFPATAPKPSLDELESEWLQLQADSTAVVLVAASDSVVGCVAIRQDATIPSGLLLARLYVQPDWWEHRVGGRLHDAALRVCRELGAASINLWVLEDNARARAMYERWGWELVPGVLQTIAGGAVTEVMYRRDIR